MGEIERELGRETYKITEFAVNVNDKPIMERVVLDGFQEGGLLPRKLTTCSVVSVQADTRDGFVTWYPPVVWVFGVPPRGELKITINQKVPHVRRWLAMGPIQPPPALNVGWDAEWLIRTWNPYVEDWSGPRRSGAKVRGGGFIELATIKGFIKQRLTIVNHTTILSIYCGKETEYDVDLLPRLSTEKEKGV